MLLRESRVVGVGDARGARRVEGRRRLRAVAPRARARQPVETRSLVGAAGVPERSEGVDRRRLRFPARYAPHAMRQRASRTRSLSVRSRSGAREWAAASERFPPAPRCGRARSVRRRVERSSRSSCMNSASASSSQSPFRAASRARTTPCRPAAARLQRTAIPENRVVEPSLLLARLRQPPQRRRAR